VGSLQVQKVGSSISGQVKSKTENLTPVASLVSRAGCSWPGVSIND